MQLDSYLEIFTTMYGWAFANIIGEAFTGTGLVVLPFMIMAFNAWRQAKEQGAEQVGVFGLVDSIGTQLIVGLFVFMTCFATSPLTSLHSINLRYRPPATVTDPNPVEVSRDSGTGSTYDSALVDSIDGSMSNVSGSLAQVPAWWMSVMAISSGINNAIKSGLSSNMSELRAMEELARIATIEDPRLLNKIQRFYSECFVPAQSRFIQMPPADLSVAGQAIIASANTDYGPDDTGWMGSQLFRTEPGFYRVTFKEKTMRGLVEVNRETEFSVDSAESFRAFARKLGASVLYHKTKKGTAWKSGDVLAELVRVDGLGDFLEVETLRKDEDPAGMQAAITSIRAVMERCGLGDADIETRTYRELLGVSEWAPAGAKNDRKRGMR